MVCNVALQKIGWWSYLPWICWDLIQTGIWYFIAVETKGRTLEELDEIFKAPNPVKASLEIAEKATKHKVDREKGIEQPNNGRTANEESTPINAN
ncbi:uncharacterized protein L201_005548 [Kwoniella dendrophila CBS 6074]|uniref:Uncharacterized protein n=1 Tax=Kwoniella dendrophila CBS 6074 TaxID=1295534 RepID=A0AAX4K130_9TREE